jgi:O-antigen ligase
MIWEEDPRFQQANYRFLRGAVGISGVACASLSLLWHDWVPIVGYLATVLVLALAILVYGLIAFVIVQAILLVVRAVQWLRRLCPSAKRTPSV